MKMLFFSGQSDSGKTATALGIGMKLQEKGLKICYYKPLGYQKGVLKVDDDDVFLMRSALKLPYPSNVLSPITVNQNYLTTTLLKENNSILTRLDQALESCTKDCDLVLVDGAFNPCVGASLGADDFSLAKRWQAAVVQILRPEDDFQLDRALIYHNLWQFHQVKVLGCILNNISRKQWDKTKGIYGPILEHNEMEVLGFIPRQLEIAAPTVSELYNALGGEVLTAKDKMDSLLVEEILVGTMTIEGALGYLRRAPNKALITGGDRSDLALTALETSTSVIIFTGGLYPDVRVLSRAEEKGVPVILVHGDTFTTVENLHSVYRSIHPRNVEAIHMVKKMIEKHVRWERLEEYARE